MNSLDLSGAWQLCDSDGGNACVLQLPGDVHSALLAAGLIPDPFVGLNEEEVQWVGERDWVASRRIELLAELLSASSIYVNADVIDTFCEVRINGVVAGECGNHFRRWRFEVKELLQAGENSIELRFRSPRVEMRARATELPYEIPCNNNAHGPKFPHYNLIRKPMCHAGWDWGIPLQSMGVLGDFSLNAAEVRIEYVTTRQEHCEDYVRLLVAVELVGDPAGLSATLDGQPLTKIGPAEFAIDIREPRLWWPNGYGEQPLYELAVTVPGQSVRKRIGLRKLEVISEPDDVGRPLVVRVNDCGIFCKGANWIPTDALPARQHDHYKQLILSARAAHMNMLRVWGGGQYEADRFYELCDEHGILVWQDFMFSCALYPADPDFLAEIAAEVTHQVKRLRDHACIALWCGDNECVGALNWYEVSRQNRDRYLLDWARLNDVRGQAALAADPTRTYWPSSPCAGPDDFSDNWHDDRCGDMHFWSVWHEGKSFDAYHAVKPRFCSEFGYQSFNSLESVRSYCPPEDMNITAPTMEFHQRNPGGNSRINEMFSRYFRMPVGFAETLYLSQVQQAVAIKTAVEYWRSLRPHCMGTLYWQLNDIWPVASWASIEYGGRWKQLHHHARRFFQPVAGLVLQREGTIELWAVNDRPQAEAVHVELQLWTFEGEPGRSETWAGVLPAGSSTQIACWPIDHFAADFATHFLQLTLTGDGTIHRNTHFFTEYKRCRLAHATVEATQHGNTLTLSTDKPAFFVTATSQAGAEFDDNSITLLPGAPRTLTLDVPITQLDLMHLRQAY